MSASRWVRSPLDCQAHLLAADQPRGVLQAQCGHVMPRGLSEHERPPGGIRCSSCSVMSWLPAPRFPSRLTPAGRRSSTSDAPGGQSNLTPLPAPRWGRCLADQQLHLLAPTGVVEAEVTGCSFSLCGCLIFVEGLMLSVSRVPGSLCASCLDAGTSS
jgi:hypothetical protein